MMGDGGQRIDQRMSPPIANLDENKDVVLARHHVNLSTGTANVARDDLESAAHQPSDC